MCIDLSRPDEPFSTKPAWLTICTIATAALCRQLAYTGAEFELTHVALKEPLQLQYNRSSNLWQVLQLVLLSPAVFGPKLRDNPDSAVPGKPRRTPPGGIFWGSHQRFFKNMLMAAKVLSLSKEAHEALAAGKCVVIGLQSTGEANQKDNKEEEGAPLPGTCLLSMCS